LKLPDPAEDAADARMARSSGVASWLPWLLLYPLRGFGLPVMLMVTAFVTVGMGSRPFVEQVPLTGIPLLAITAMWTLIYLQSVIRQTARGHALPPPMSAEVVFLSGAFQPLLLPALLATAWSSLHPAHPLAAQALVMLAGAVLPLYLFILATSESLAAALNPLRWLHDARQLGLAYLAVVLLLWGAQSALFAVSGRIGMAAWAALGIYLLLMLAHLLGFVGFRRHQALGLHVEVPNPDAAAREREQEERLQRLQVRIEQCLQRGDTEGAAREIEAEPGGPVSARHFHESLFQSLLARRQALLVHVAGRRLIRLLLAERRAERALDVAEQCIGCHPYLVLDSAEQLETLAGVALQKHYLALFEKLARLIEEQYPESVTAVTVRWQQARYLAEHRGEEAAALSLLRALLPRAQQHPQRVRMEAFLRALEKLQKDAVPR
jgi:hypothetical protein